MIPQRTGTPGRLSLMLGLLVILLSFESTSAIYLPRKEESEVISSRQEVVEEFEPMAKEDNQIYRHHETSDFRYDEDILRYLRVCGRQLMIWRCRNGVQSYWDRVTGIVPFVDLYCSVIGNVATVDWYHKHKKINSEAERSSHKYDAARKDHQERGRHFTVWTDHRLRIHNVTRTDSGMYRFEVTSPDGVQVDEQFIFVDVSSGGTSGASSGGSSGGSKWGSDANNHTKRKKKKKKTKTKRLWQYHAPLTVDPSTD